MRPLSKSKIIAFRQCPKRLWLEVHRPDLREDSSAAQAAFQVGYQVGEIARRIYDPEGQAPGDGAVVLRGAFTGGKGFQVGEVSGSASLGAGAGDRASQIRAEGGSAGGGG